jgi:diadenosine tetraphosphate (Ap4A) HIT family hydrolase
MAEGALPRQDVEVVGCLACDVVAGRLVSPGGVIYEDESWMLDHAVSPVLLDGFLILKPKRHVEHVGQLSTAEAAALGPLLCAACAAVSEVAGAEQVYVASFGESVRHVHWYLLPRRAGQPASGLGMLQGMFRGDWACSDEAAAQTAARVRDVLPVHLR